MKKKQRKRILALALEIGISELDMEDPSLWPPASMCGKKVPDEVLKHYIKNLYIRTLLTETRLAMGRE